MKRLGQHLWYFLIFTSCHRYNDNHKIVPTVNELEINPKNFPFLSIDNEIESWTIKMRRQTIDEVNGLKFDSIVRINEGDCFINEFSYYKGVCVRAIGLTKDKMDTLGFYYQSPTNGFMANGETCPNHNTELIRKGGLHTYRGLKFNDKHIGMATYLQCDNSSFEKGLYYEGNRIGIWRTIDINGEMIKQDDYKNESLLTELRLFTDTLH